MLTAEPYPPQRVRAAQRDARHGARIEDIVVCTADGVERLNITPTELAPL